MGGEEEEPSIPDDSPQEPTQQPPISLEDVPEQVTVSRVGVGRPLSHGLDLSPPSTDLLIDMLPSVELIPPVNKIEDTVTSTQIESNDFMRGIFYYAGIDPNDRDLFQANGTTEMALEQATGDLNDRLRESWSQGSDLEFRLRHRRQSIALTIKDPAVNTQFVEPSRRSTGFTHYFALKSILYARQRDGSKDSFILLFDEPGLYLHPAGQQDLLREMDLLSTESQVIYATHSVFMINRTYPTRHRLIRKDENGTIIEGKPYVSRWGAVFDALGLSLTGTVLFAHQVLLTEGDSDPIYIQRLLQELVERDVISADLNGFVAMATGESRTADSLIRILRESNQPPRLAALFDGDEGGIERLAAIEPILASNDIPYRHVGEDVSIEDILPHPEQYARAVAVYLAKLRDDLGDAVGDLDSWIGKFTDSFSNRSEVSVVAWANGASESIAEITKPSKVGIAREYVALLESDPKDLDATWTQAQELAKWIVEKLALEPTTGNVGQILRQS